MENHPRNRLHFIDWMLKIAQQFDVALANYEEQQKMRYVTSIERHGIEKGQLQNSHAYIIEVLKLRFQQIPEKMISAIEKINDLSVLSVLHKEAVLAQSLALFEKTLVEMPKTD